MDTDWAVRGDGTGSWIKLQFTGAPTLTAANTAINYANRGYMYIPAMTGQRYFGGTALLPGTYVARTDNDNGEDCKRQCEDNPECDAWEFGSWANKFHCANWGSTASGRWAPSTDRLAAGLASGECSIGKYR